MDAVVDRQALKVANKARTRRLVGRVLMLAGVAVVAIGGLTFWLMGGRYVSTDDAYVEANKLMVSTDVSGLVLDVDVKEGQSVHKGDILFRLDPKPFAIAVANAKSQLAQSVLNIRSMEQDYKRMLRDIDAQKAQVQLAQTSYVRQQALIKIGGTAQANVDQAEATLGTAAAQDQSLRQQAEVQLAKLGGSVGPAARKAS